MVPAARNSAIAFSSNARPSPILRQAGATPVAAVIALDRQEQGPGGVSAVAEMEREHGLHMIALVNVREMLEFLEGQRLPGGTVAAIRKYQAQYGVPA